ncbi:MAG: archaeosortase/exosortase family protein [Bryobacteraceae bacterium]
MNGLAVATMQAAAMWPAWIWYGRRLTDGSDGAWSAMALAAFAALLAAVPASKGKRIPLAGPIALMVVYAAAAMALPPIFGCAAALLAVGSTLARWRLGPGVHWPMLALAVLGAPMVASLDFTCGFPLRFLAAKATAALLALGGLSVAPEGTLLRWGAGIVEIDAPCSGARMLYAGLFLTAALAAWRRLSLARTAAAFAVALPAIVAANVFRSTGLFFVETGLIELPAVAHPALGVMVFGLLSIFLLRANRHLAGALQTR